MHTSNHQITILFPVSDYTEGAELVESVLDVVQKQVEGVDSLQGELMHISKQGVSHMQCRLTDHTSA